jgi:hypothetical protein|tara:strand:- start:606 stop:725 length:120 start_codon:yes stop_codon:yes gene_type:complete
MQAVVAGPEIPEVESAGLVEVEPVSNMLERLGHQREPMD